ISWLVSLRGVHTCSKCSLTLLDAVFSIIFKYFCFLLRSVDSLICVFFDCMKFAFVVHLFFFFQAEDGIRDWSVTGVQTCALPIYDVTIRVPANFVVWGTGTLRNASEVLQPQIAQRFQSSLTSDNVIHVATLAEMKSRSEERRVGKEWRDRGSRCQYRRKG